MKTNGITYDENNLPLAKGSWSQIIAYLISDIKNKQEVFFNEVLLTGNTPTLTIVNTTHLPQQTTLELYNPMPNVIRSPRIEIRNITYNPQPIIIRTPSSELYKKCPNFPEDDMANERCRARLHFCYTYIKEQNDVVTTGDLSVFKLKQNDCGIAYTKAINNGKPHYTIKVKQELNKYFREGYKTGQTWEEWKEKQTRIS
jgi:hypothetical protein